VLHVAEQFAIRDASIDTNEMNIAIGNSGGSHSVHRLIASPWHRETPTRAAMRQIYDDDAPLLTHPPAKHGVHEYIVVRVCEEIQVAGGSPAHD
jgi:hypothetical protein